MRLVVDVKFIQDNEILDLTSASTATTLCHDFCIRKTLAIYALRVKQALG